MGGSQYPAPPWHCDPQLLLQSLTRLQARAKLLNQHRPARLLPGTSGFLKWMGDTSSTLVTCYSTVFSKRVKHSWHGAGYALLPSRRDELSLQKEA